MTVCIRPDFDQRLAAHRVVTRDRDVAYLDSYEIILAHFRRATFGDSAACKAESDAGVLLVYTWMGGAAPKLSALSSYSACYSDIQAARRGDNLSEEQLERIKTYVSGSMIGASKFLHFLKPDKFPIWDRRVAGALYGLPHYSQHQKVSTYLQYLNDLPSVSVSADLEAEIVALLGEVSAVRRAEFAIFNLDVAEKRRLASGSL